MIAEKSSTSCYTGLPPNFKGWVSEHVFGREDNPDTQNKSYRTFKLTDGQYGLQETCREGTGEIEHQTEPWNNTIVAIGTFNQMVEKHLEYTNRTPWTITSPDGTLKDGTIEFLKSLEAMTFTLLIHNLFSGLGRGCL